MNLPAAFAGLATAFAETMGAPFHDAILHYPGEPVVDDGGSIVDPGTPSEVPCRAQVDVVTEDMRLDADFLARDVRLLILGPVMLTTEPELEVTDGPFAGQRYSLKSVARDPAGIGWEARGRGL